MRIGVLGGSFDPVHRGHLALAEGARDALRLDRVLLVPAARQPHKPAGPVASAEDRYAMLRLATRGRRGIELSDLELERPGPSYTVDTLRALRQSLPADGELFLLLGADAAADFPGWRDAEAIGRLATVVPCSRPGHALPDGDRSVVPVTTPDVSATAIRRRVARGEPVADLVGPDVAAYIAARGLYAA